MRSFASRLAVLLAIAGGGLALAASHDFAAERRAMVAAIQLHVTRSAEMTGVPRIDERVLAAFAKVPRHVFVPPPLVDYAYEDTPLPLGHGQNLTQPFLAALMTQVLEIKPGESVFETGTDTGYQAAILVELGARVYSMEIVEPLFDVAKRIFAQHQAYRAINLRLGDGYYGWSAHSPYDAMLIKESAAAVPPPLLAQLKPGGRMIIPLGPPSGPQFLTLVRKDANGAVRENKLLPVRFTPFQGGDRI